MAVTNTRDVVTRTVSSRLVLPYNIRNRIGHFTDLKRGKDTNREQSSYFIPGSPASGHVVQKSEGIKALRLLIEKDRQDAVEPVFKSYSVQYKSGINSDLSKALVIYEPHTIPDPEIVPRTDIKLETDEERDERLTKVRVSKALAYEIKEQVKSGQCSSIKPTTMRTTKDNFFSALSFAAGKLGIEEVVNDDEIVALTSYYCLETEVDKSLKNHGGFLKCYPDGFFEPGNDASTLIKKVVLAKHFIIDLKGISTAKQIEDAKRVTKELKKAGLGVVANSFSLNDLYKILFEGYMEGENPPIRPWIVEYQDKWKGEAGKELATRACRWVLKYGEKVVFPCGLYDKEEIRKRNWSEAFYKEEYRLKGMMVSSPHIRNCLDALKLGAPDLIGLEDTQIKPWEIRHFNMWRLVDDKGGMLIDQVTEYIVEKYLPKNGVHTVGPDQKPLASVIKAYPRWARLYDDVTRGSLEGSNMRAIDALNRRYPEMFGYGREQIKPWEIRYENMWAGEKGETLFREAFAYTLYSLGLGNLNENVNPPTYSFTLDEFQKWYQEEMETKGNNLTKVLSDSTYGIFGGLRCSSADDSLRTAIKILFGIDNDDVLPKVKTSIKYETRKTFEMLLKRQGNMFSMSFTPFGTKQKEPKAVVQIIPRNQTTHNTAVQTKGEQRPLDKVAANSTSRASSLGLEEFLFKDIDYSVEQVGFGDQRRVEGLLSILRCQDKKIREVLLQAEIAFNHSDDNSRSLIGDLLLGKSRLNKRDEYYLSNEQLRLVIKVFRECFIPILGIDRKSKEHVSATLNLLLSEKEKLRSRLASELQKPQDKKFLTNDRDGKKTNTLSLINIVLVYFFGELADNKKLRMVLRAK